MIYSCIDMGSDTIKIVVGRIDNNNLSVLASINTRSSGIKRGIIIDKEKVINSILNANKELEKTLGFKIDKAVITVPLVDVSVDVYSGMSYPNGVISGDDIITCFKSSISMIEMDREVITVFPIDFTIDGLKKVNDPKGMEANKLECRMLVSTIAKNMVYPYLEVFKECNIEVIDLSFGVINDYYNVTKNYSNNCGALIDIGHDKTEIGIFNKGLFVKGETLPFGSRLVDHDISYIYQVNKDEARTLKEDFAYATKDLIDKDEIREIGEDKKLIPKIELSEVVNARLLEILKNVKNSLNSLTNRKISYIIIAGGITNIIGFDSILKDVFKEECYSLNMNVIGAKNNIYTNSVGMIKYYYDKLNIRGIDYTMYENIENLINKKELHSEILDKIKKYCEDN